MAKKQIGLAEAAEEYRRRCSYIINYLKDTCIEYEALEKHTKETLQSLDKVMQTLTDPAERGQARLGRKRAVDEVESYKATIKKDYIFFLEVCREEVEKGKAICTARAQEPGAERFKTVVDWAEQELNKLVGTKQ
jgi:hypothetical protein